MSEPEGSPLWRRKTTTNHEIDMCPLYGRTVAQTDALREKSEASGRKGRLKSQVIEGEEYAPFYYDPAHPGARRPKPEFLALDPPLGDHSSMSDAAEATVFAFGGDRANGSPFVAMMNTLFVREHNWIAGEIERRNPAWDDERVFQTARNILIPIFIKSVVEEYINHITPSPFRLKANAAVCWAADWNRPNWITAEFSLLYRWHPLLPDAIDWPTGTISLAEFSRMDNRPLLATPLAEAFAAASRQPAGEIGALNTGDALLGLERMAVRQARAHEMASYNDYREAFGMPRARSFAEINPDPAVRDKLEQLYATPEDVEFYPGLFAEARVRNSPLPGLLLRMVAVDAFTQALTNPLLSAHVFNAKTFTDWGFGHIQATNRLEQLLARNCPTPPRAGSIRMTQPGWAYG